LYKRIRIIGKVVGWLICVITIDLIDLTDSYILNYLIIAPMLEWILRKMSYWTCNIIIYQKLDINESEIGSFGYWIFYIIYTLILFAILSVLKNNGVIPLVTNLDIIIFEGVVNFITNILMDSINNIVNILQT
jgi:hypothetical protein